METVKLYWNFTDKKYNLVEKGKIIPEGNYARQYVIPAEANFIDPRKSRLVRMAYKLHLFFRKYIPKKIKKENISLGIFTNPDLGTKWEKSKEEEL